MDFTYTDEQEQLRRTLRAYLDDLYPFSERLAAARAEGWRPDIWRALSADLGILGIGLPAHVGGTGGGAIEHMIVMEELGRALALEPYVETVIVAGTALAADGGTRACETLRRIVAGDCVVAPAWAEPQGRHALSPIETRARPADGGWRIDGTKSAVASGGIADLLLVSAQAPSGPSLFLVEAAAPGVRRHIYPTIDGRRGADVVLGDVFVPADAMLRSDAGAEPLMAALFDRAIAGVAAEGLGLMTRAREDTRAYVTQRRQFGRPLGDFQVIQHRLVDMFVEGERASAAALLVALRLDDSAEVRAQAASAAKVVLGNAMRFVGQNAVQLHGGMGVTDDLAVGHAFKRMTLIDGDHGTVDYHLKRYAGPHR